MSKNKQGTVLWLNDARGVYIPRDFAGCFQDRAKNVSGVEPGEWEFLEAGPEAAWYWETWDNVLSNAVVTDNEGVRFRLHQDGDLWLVPEGMEWSEEADEFIWPEESEGENATS